MSKFILWAIAGILAIGGPMVLPRPGPVETVPEVQRGKHQIDWPNVTPSPLLGGPAPTPVGEGEASGDYAPSHVIIIEPGPKGK
jgi:hypothetical protein